MASRTGAYDPAFTLSTATATGLSQLCQADIVRICEDALKRSLLTGSPLTDDLFRQLCADRQAIYDADQIAV